MKKENKIKKMELTTRYEIRLRYQSFDQAVAKDLKDYIQTIVENPSLVSFIRLPVRKKRITVLRSPHVNKKSREQLEIRLYNGLIILSGFSFPTDFYQMISTFSKSSVSLKVSVEIVPLV